MKFASSSALFCTLLGFVPLLAHAALPLNGADISSLPMLEGQGIKYSDGGVVKPFEQILASHGHKLARIRVWTAGTYTQSYAISLAKRAKAAGLKILVDLHYSDTCTFISALYFHVLTCVKGLIQDTKPSPPVGQRP